MRSDFSLKNRENNSNNNKKILTQTKSNGSAVNRGGGGRDRATYHCLLHTNAEKFRVWHVTE